MVNLSTKLGLVSKYMKPAFRSFVFFLKLLRNKLVSYLYTRFRCHGFTSFRSLLEECPNRNFLCIVAFNLPWSINLMIRACRVHLPEWQIIIFDNSSNPQARLRIQNTCSSENVPYLSLPRNPEWSPNRSHAIALNWIYYNVIRPCHPENFGFLDHDCFPFTRNGILDHISNQAVYGFHRPSSVSPGAWNLWAGYMFFNFRLISRYRLDFNHDQARNLDTGGRNWVKLYRYLNEVPLVQAYNGERKVCSLNGSQVYRVQCIDYAFLHIGGASYRDHGEDSEDFIPTIRSLVENSLHS